MELSGLPGDCDNRDYRLLHRNSKKGILIGLSVLDGFYRDAL
jgi:hypothetical protein